MVDIFVGIITVIWMVIFLVAYHKIFTVYYFSLSRGILREIGISLIAAAVMTYLTVKLWFVTAIIVIVAGIMMGKKAEKKSIAVMAVIFAIVFSILGIISSSELDEKYALNTNQNEIYLKA